jgi:hypothetical protein
MIAFEINHVRDSGQLSELQIFWETLKERSLQMREIGRLTS